MKVTEIRDKEKIVNFGEDYLTTFEINLNPKANGSENVSLEIDVFENEDHVKYYNIHINGQCYGEHTFKIGLYGEAGNLDNLIDSLLDVQKQIRKI